MNKVLLGALVVIAIFAVLAVVVISIQNSLISLNISVDQSWSEVRNQYQRQADLIPNLIQTTKDYMKFEYSLLTNLTAARTAWLNAVAQSEVAQDAAGQQVFATVGGFVATVENYPDLKSSQVVMTLMDELEGTQNRITVARGRYIEKIGDYNKAVQTFPGSLFGFQRRDFYQGSAFETPPNATLGNWGTP